MKSTTLTCPFVPFAAPLTPAPRPALRTSQLLCSLAAAGLVLMSPQAAWSAASRAGTVARAGAVQGILLRFKAVPTDVQTATRALLGDHQLASTLRFARQLGAQWVLVEADQPMAAAQAETLVRELRRDARLDHVLANAHEQRAMVPNDPLFRDATTPQWWLDDYDATTSPAVANFTHAWDISTGAGSPVIAVLDTGITSHPDLDANMLLPGYNFISNATYAGNSVGRSATALDYGDGITAAQVTANPGLYDGCNLGASNGAPSSWHGTLVAGQLAAVSNNGAGVAGINWYAKVLPVRVAGQCGALVSDMVDGMNWAAGVTVPGVPANANPAKVLVIGFAGLASCSKTDPDPTIAAAATLYTDTISALRAKGVFIVAAAGNQQGAVGRPANCPGVFAVTAVNRLGYKARYANYGAEVQLAAPGGDQADASKQLRCDTISGIGDSGVVSTSNKGTQSPDLSPTGYSYAAVSGTSFAAPQVAGTAALMWAKNPALTLAQIETGLKLSARPHVIAPALGYCSDTNNNNRCTCTTTTCGAGLLDAAQALTYSLSPAAYTAPTLSALRVESDALSSCGAAQGSTPIASPPPPPPPSPAPSPAPTPAPTPAAPAPAPASGGGAMSGLWILGLLAAARMLEVRRRRS